MAEAIVSSLIKELGSSILEEAKFLGGVKTQIKSLRNELEWIRSFLRNADEKRKRNEKVNVRESQVRDLAFDAEYIIDLFMLQVQRQQQRNIGLKFLGYPKHLFTLHKLGNKIKDFKRETGEISDNKSRYGIEAGETSSACPDDDLVRKLRRASFEEEVDVVGFGKDAEKLTSLLKQEASSHQLLVFSIVGMGGSGKTTLAKKVYNDVKNNFDSCALIYVSEEYRINDLLCKGIAQLTMLSNKELEKKDEGELKNVLSDHSKEKRCLLVFDDVWQKADWDELKRAFLGHQKNGWKQQTVLITTRHMEVANHADPSIDPHEIKPLSDEESFELFKRKVFQCQVGSEERSDHKDLEVVGKELVAKCHGLPLAIVVLGGLLRGKRKTLSEWDRVLKSVNWHLDQGQGTGYCGEILGLSYKDLPYCLKSCFLYFGLFPEDLEINSKKLIRLWAAEGFIQERGDETMEDVAEDYLEELIGRSMIQAAGPRRLDGSVESVRIHDLLRDLAVSEAKKDKLLEIHGVKCSTTLNRFRWLAIHPNSNDRHNLSTSPVHHLRSLFWFNTEGLHKNLWKDLYLGFNLLRVLDLEGVRSLYSLPKEIGGLVLLKYLNLNRTKIRRIPHSMGNLCNLQTLDLSRTYIRDIPKEIWRMKQLRHLYCYGIEFPSSSIEHWVNKVVGKKIGQSCFRPSRVDNLRDLQTLCLPAGNWIEGGLEQLTNLREVRIDGDLRLHTKALTDSIVNLKKLRSLELYDYGGTVLPGVSFSHNDQLYKLSLGIRLEKTPALEDFPVNLAELYLRRSHLKQEDQPMATLEKLPNLKLLQLWKSFEGKEMICSGGGFPKLQRLRLELLYELEDLKVEQGAFPCLKVLTIEGCSELKMLPDGLRHVTTLQELEIIVMPKEFTARVQQQPEPGEDWEKIKHIRPSVTIRNW